MRLFIKIILLLIFAGTVTVCCLVFWLGSGSLTPAKTNFLQKFPYPIALVNGSPVASKDFFTRLNAAKKTTEKSDATVRADVFLQLVNDKKIRLVAAAHGLWLNQKEIDDDYTARSSEAGFEKALADAGLSKANFSSQIIEPELFLTKLKIWFNSKKSLNPDAYNLADSLVQKINQGEDVAGLASAYSQDQTGKIIGGDLGFIDPTNLLLEMREPVINLQMGEIKALPSRFGIHIFKKEGQSGNKIHLRQIFIQTGSFESWLEPQKRNMKVWNLVKI